MKGTIYCIAPLLLSPISAFAGFSSEPSQVENFYVINSQKFQICFDKELGNEKLLYSISLTRDDGTKLDFGKFNVVRPRNRDDKCYSSDLPFVFGGTRNSSLSSSDLRFSNFAQMKVSVGTSTGVTGREKWDKTIFENTYTMPSQRPHADLSDCQFAALALSQVRPLMDDAINLYQNKATHKDVVQWHTTKFRKIFNESKDYLDFDKSAQEKPNRTISASIYNDVYKSMNPFALALREASQIQQYPSPRVKEKYQPLISGFNSYFHQCEGQKAVAVKETTKTSEVIKKSKSGICHDKFSRSYNRTATFTAYNTIQACLDSGGRLPKK